MKGIDDIVTIRNDEEFSQAALALFRFQAERCEPYRQYLELLGINPAEVCRVEDIPCLPIELFKSHTIYCGEGEPEVVFTSSSTTGQTPSRHPMARLSIYERAFTAAFRQFYGDPSEYGIYALLPSYLQRKGSSLVYMADHLISAAGAGGFYLDDYERLIADMEADPKPKILLGVSYALWELAERYAPCLRNTIVMETGGMKGYREEIPKAEFHRILTSAFGVERIHSEYGMAELTSQAYSLGEGVFRTPRWMKVLVRDINDPFTLLAEGSRGGVNIIDLANIYSCAFIETQDVGRRFADDSFTIEGRIDRSEIRGCNLLIQ
ncbi:MAG: acyltransferase [Rikenellaceae bacterium]|nr:acyltransferase [Rikenellaceae bacterium]